MLKAFCFIAPKSCLPPLPSFFLYKLFSTLVFILSSCLSFCYVFSNLLSFPFLSFFLPVCRLSSSFPLHLFFLSVFSPQFFLLLLHFDPHLSTFLPLSPGSFHFVFILFCSFLNFFFSYPFFSPYPSSLFFKLQIFPFIFPFFSLATRKGFFISFYIYFFCFSFYYRYFFFDFFFFYRVFIRC